MNNLIKEILDFEASGYSTLTQLEYYIVVNLINKLEMQGKEKIEIKNDFEVMTNNIINISNFLMNLNLKIEDKDLYKSLQAVNSFTVISSKNFRVHFNKEVFDNLTFKSFLLDENYYNLGKLNSKYSKMMFCYLMKIRKDKLTLTNEEFRNILSIPISYRSTDVDNRVINVIEKELTPITGKFFILKDKKGRGGKILNYQVNIGNYFDKDVYIEKKINKDNAKVSDESKLISRLGDI